MIKITEVVMVWFGGDLILKTYIYVFCELGPVKKPYIYVRRCERVKPLQMSSSLVLNDPKCNSDIHCTVPLDKELLFETCSVGID